MTPRADLLTPAASSDFMASLAQHAGALAANRCRNVRTRLVVYGVPPENSTKAGERGVGAHALRKRGLACRVGTGSRVVRATVKLVEFQRDSIDLADFRRNPRSEPDNLIVTFRRDGEAR